MRNHTRETWIDAAFDQFNKSGLGSVKVETLSRTLYATKGSFYWHFENRSDLIGAVMAKWEHADDPIMAIAESAPTPRERLVVLFTQVAERMYARGGERTLFAEAEAEGVLDVVQRVIQRRVDFVTRILRENDVEAPEERAALSIGAVIGLQQMVTGGWEPLTGEALTRVMLQMSLAPLPEL